MATMKVQHQELLQRLCDEALLKSGAFNSQGIANTLWAMFKCMTNLALQLWPQAGTAESIRDLLYDSHAWFSRDAIQLGGFFRVFQSAPTIGLQS
jgi:hypothetical protein